MLTRVLRHVRFLHAALRLRFLAAFTLTLIGLTSTTAWSEPKDIRWGTGPIGSVGQKPWWSSPTS